MITDRWVVHLLLRVGQLRHSLDHIDDEIDVSFSIASQSGMFDVILFLLAPHVLVIGWPWATVPFHEARACSEFASQSILRLWQEDSENHECDEPLGRETHKPRPVSKMMDDQARKCRTEGGADTH